MVLKLYNFEYHYADANGIGIFVQGAFAESIDEARKMLIEHVKTHKKAIELVFELVTRANPFDIYPIEKGVLK